MRDQTSDALAKWRRWALLMTRGHDGSIGKSIRRDRLNRWAMLLERDPHRLIGLLRPFWASSGDLTPIVVKSGAIDIAWRDPVFRVTGFNQRSRRGVKAFFGLSNAELDRIVSGSSRLPVRPAWQIAGRIRNVADPRPERVLVLGVIAMIVFVAWVAQWLR